MGATENSRLTACEKDSREQCQRLEIKEASVGAIENSGLTACEKDSRK